MDRSELNKKANDYISNAGYGRGTNITLHGLKCMMVDFYLDNQVKTLPIADVIVPKGTLCEHAYGENGCYMMDTNQSCTPHPKDSEC